MSWAIHSCSADLEDVTDLKALEAEALEKRKKLEKLSDLISIEEAIFASFVEESKKIVDPNDISKMHNFAQHDRRKDIREIEMVRDDTERVKEKVKRPNTVNIYSQEDDLILKDSSLRGQASDEKELEKFKNNAARHW